MLRGSMRLDQATQCLGEETIAAWISGALGEDALKRAEAHVETCATCRSLVADAAHGAMHSRWEHDAEARNLAQSNETRVPSSRAWTRPLPGPGEVLAEKYRVERVLASGGMGAVLTAFHIELGHRVAIKVLHHGGHAAAARFLREAQTCARLTNDHIVRVFDLGRLPDGAPYLVMEYLVGEDLASLVSRERVPIAKAVEYVLQACAALVAAHDAGVVHRDLKPANLFLTKRSNGAALVKVIDFGISKVQKENAPELLTLTSTGMVLGSPLYMSPEQIRAASEVDARTDIWSLGVILYELITGRAPFTARSFSALSVAIATDPVVRPSSLCPEVSPDLESILLRCLAKDREARFPSVAALARALETLAAGQADKRALSTSNETFALSRGVKASPAAGSSPWRKTVLASVGAGLAIGAAVIWLSKSLTRPETNDASAPKVVAPAPHRDPCDAGTLSRSAVPRQSAAFRAVVWRRRTEACSHADPVEIDPRIGRAANADATATEPARRALGSP